MREKKGALEKERGSGQGSDARREGGAGKNRHWKDQEATSCDYKNTKRQHQGHLRKGDGLKDEEKTADA